MTTKLGIVACALFALTSTGRLAHAEAKGQLLITKDRVAPGDARARLREIHMVWPAEEHGNDDTTWVINYAARLPRPLGDYQSELKLWDVTKGPARFVSEEDQLTRDKETRVLVGQVRVSAPAFERNHRYLARLERGGTVLAEVTFWLRGAPPRYDGRVDFADGDAAPRAPGQAISAIDLDGLAAAAPRDR